MKNDDLRPVVTIYRGACYGSCPVYSAEVYLDGTVVYKGEMFVEVEGERRFKITEKKVRELIGAFEKADFFSFNATYDSRVTCVPWTTTSFEYNGRRKKVHHDSQGPLALSRLEDKIDRIAGLKKLIGKRE